MAPSSARRGRVGFRGDDQGISSTGAGGQLHPNASETPTQHESSDDDDSTVGRRGPVAPTPLPDPRNREWIYIIHDQFSNQEKATRTIGEILQAMWSHPWQSWKVVSEDDANRMFERFKGYYQWDSEWNDQVYSCWKKFKKGKFKHVLSRARENAKKAARKAGVEVGDDLSVIIPYKPRWMRSEFWEPLVQSWNTSAFKAKSSRNADNRKKSTGGKHTLGSQTYVTLKLKADSILGRPTTLDELWMQSHGKKGTRPLDKLLGRRGEGSHEADSFEEIDLQNNVEWVDSRAKESLRSYQEHVTEKYKDDTGKRPLYDQDSWIQAVGGKKKGRLYGFNHISDPHAVMMGTPSMSGTSSYLPARNEEVQQLNEKIIQLQQEKEAERLEKEKERAEKFTMMGKIEENRVANAEMKEENAEMKKQIEFLLKNISKSYSN